LTCLISLKNGCSNFLTEFVNRIPGKTFSTTLMQELYILAYT